MAQVSFRAMGSGRGNFGCPPLRIPRGGAPMRARDRGGRALCQVSAIWPHPHEDGVAMVSGEVRAALPTRRDPDRILMGPDHRG